MLRWGIVGVGRAGTARAAALRQDPRATPVMGFGGRPEAAGLASARSLEELFEAVDAVAVCAPDREHPTLVLRGLEAGCFVLCEFPLCRRPELAAELLGTGRVHVEHIELLTPTAMALRALPGVRSASLHHRGQGSRVAPLHRALDCLGSPSGVEAGRLVYPDFHCALDLGPGPRGLRFTVQAEARWEQRDRELTRDGAPVELPSGPGLFLQDQLAASARFLDGAASYVSDERVVQVLSLAAALRP